MSNSIRKKILVLVIVFIVTLLMTRIYLHVYPDSELFKGSVLFFFYSF